MGGGGGGGGNGVDLYVNINYQSTAVSSLSTEVCTLLQNVSLHHRQAMQL
jgi:hypothetical protein